jgi:2-amino-4-hydroxy-6-hydroxymethyldihydropteridine diphosphokinase
MNKVYLLIGGNLGDREANMAEARALIGARCGPLRATSSLYCTAAWGLQDQPDFLNQALLLDTGSGAPELLESLLAIERTMGRTRGERYGPRSIDIDILFFNDQVISVPGLEIPHPRMADRRFVLTPLAEIAPGLRHPITGVTVTEMLEQCPDKLPVHKYEGVVHKNP